MSLGDRKFIESVTPDFATKVRKLASPIPVRGIGNKIHNSDEYILMNGFIKGTLTEMVEKLTRQRVAAPAVNRRMEDQLERLEKITGRLEEESAKEKGRVDNWAKRATFFPALALRHQCETIARNSKLRSSSKGKRR